MTTPLPDGYALDYYVFILCDGQIERKEGIEDRYTLSDGVRWSYLKAYDNLIRDELFAIAQKRAKKK